MTGVCQGLVLDRAEVLLRCFTGDCCGQAVYLRRRLDSTIVRMHYCILQDQLKQIGRQFQPYMFTDPDAGLEQVR